MNDERQGEQAGAPVEETEASSHDVQEAVDRAAEHQAPPASETAAYDSGQADPAAPAYSEQGFGSAGTGDTGAGDTAAPQPYEQQSAAGAQDASTSNPFDQQRPAVAPADPLPTAGPAPQAAAQPTAPPMTQPYPADQAAAAPTQVYPAQGQYPGQPEHTYDAPARDGEIRITPDHPMAGLYVQAPMPPTPRGNRGAGVLISLLATLGFAVVFAGVIALILAPFTPPSQFVDTFIETITAWGSIFAVIAFFVGMVILVLIVGRAGWWAYVLGGFLVGLFVWAAYIAGLVIDEDGFGELFNTPLDELFSVGFYPIAVAALVVAREATVWFGAWIGRRGRKVTRENAEALAEYESALAEVQARQP